MPFRNRNYIPDKWRWDGFRLQMYQKGILTGLNNTKVSELLDKNPLSMAVTSGTDRWEYLRNSIIQAENPIDKWAQLIQELRHYAEMEAGDILGKEIIPPPYHMGIDG